jgi:hypothetical protein
MQTGTMAMWNLRFHGAIGAAHGASRMLDTQQCSVPQLQRRVSCTLACQSARSGLLTRRLSSYRVVRECRKKGHSRAV